MQTFCHIFWPCYVKLELLGRTLLESLEMSPNLGIPETMDFKTKDSLILDDFWGTPNILGTPQTSPKVCFMLLYPNNPK